MESNHHPLDREAGALTIRPPLPPHCSCDEDHTSFCSVGSTRRDSKLSNLVMTCVTRKVTVCQSNIFIQIRHSVMVTLVQRPVSRLGIQTKLATSGATHINFDVRIPHFFISFGKQPILFQEISQFQLHIIVDSVCTENMHRNKITLVFLEGANK